MSSEMSSTPARSRASIMRVKLSIVPRTLPRLASILCTVGTETPAISARVFWSMPSIARAALSCAAVITSGALKTPVRPLTTNTDVQDISLDALTIQCQSGSKEPEKITNVLAALSHNSGLWLLCGSRIEGHVPRMIVEMPRRSLLPNSPQWAISFARLKRRADRPSFRRCRRAKFGKRLLCYQSDEHREAQHRRPLLFGCKRLA